MNDSTETTPGRPAIRPHHSGNPTGKGRKSGKTFSSGQIAKICDVAPRTASIWIDTGRLKGYRIPGSNDRRVTRENLIRFLKEHGMPLGELEEDQWFKVLLVGTENLFAERLTELLPGSEDFRFAVAASVFAAGLLVQSFRPDVVIVDLALGRCEAQQIALSLRERELVVIGLTGEDDAEPETLREYGFADVFRRPFDVELLGEKLRTLATAKRE